MIIILGQNLLVWIGILATISFLLAFFGCRCNIKINIRWLNRHHNKFMWLTFIFILTHITLRILAKNFGIYI